MHSSDSNPLARSVSGFEAALSTLPGDAYLDFLTDDDRREVSQHGGLVTFDGFVRDGRLVPLDAATRSHPVFSDGTVRTVAGGGGVLLPDHLLMIGLPDDEGRVRAMLLHDDVFGRLLSGSGAVARILRSEIRLGKQLVCGYNLREAAALDGVGHETKRSQYKSLAQKMGARSQSDLVARVLIRLAVEAADGGGQGRATFGEDAESLVRTYVPSARVYTLAGSGGPDHHVVEVGPADGVPFVMIHSQVLPDFTGDDLAALQERRRKIVIPLRNGALSPRAVPLDLARHMDHACTSLDRVLEHLGIDQAAMMGCISGCAYAVEYAHRNPGRVASLALVGACVRPNVGSSTAGRLRAGVLSLAMRNWAIYSKAIAFYGRRIRRPETFRQLLLSVYRPCQADLAVIEAEYLPPNGGERLRRFFCASVESIKHDFHHQAFPRWDRIGDLPMPVVFLHGTQDFIHTLASVRELSAQAGRRVRSIEGGGQLLYHRHFRPMLDAYLAFAVPEGEH